jgi:hypothetical protein
MKKNRDNLKTQIQREFPNSEVRCDFVSNMWIIELVHESLSTENNLSSLESIRKIVNPKNEPNNLSSG